MVSTHQNQLKGDPKYIPGQSKKAVFAFTIPDPKDEDGVKQLKVGTITFTWTAKAISVALSTKSPDEYAAVLDFVGLGESPGKAAKFAGATYLEFSIAEIFGARTIVLKGQTKFTEKKAGSGDEQEIYPLQSASLTGTLDTKAPVLKSTIPATVNAIIVDLRLVYADNDPTGLGDFDVSVNGRSGNEAFDEINILLPDGNGNFPVDIIGLYLDPGKNTVIFTVTDFSGNVSKVKKTITAPNF
jgi:hypothetical protein